jgi:prophage regulatory protein
MSSIIPFDDLPACAVIREPIVLAVTGYSHATLWTHVKSGAFPRPVQIGPRSVGWRVGEVRGVLASFTVKNEIDANASKAISARMSKRLGEVS